MIEGVGIGNWNGTKEFEVVEVILEGQYLPALMVIAFLGLLVKARPEGLKPTVAKILRTTWYSGMPVPKWNLPLIGHLHLLRGKNAFKDMSKLSETYGDIYELQLGSIKACVISSLELMKEVLISKGSDFGDRMDFLRYKVLFGGDKENSLAFCNWSSVQKTRRALARRCCHTGIFSDRLKYAIDEAISTMMRNINTDVSETGKCHLNLKYNVQLACCNIFFNFFCSQTFDPELDSEYLKVIDIFDRIFWEINQSHVTDVLPVMSFLYSQHLQSISEMGKIIREFVVKKVINPHISNLDSENPIDFVDILLSHLEDKKAETKLTMDQVLYELEDFLGGHSAVSNLIGHAIVEIASVEGLSMRIYEKAILKGNSSYMTSVVYETLRKTSSPIVPHVASKNTEIKGFPVFKGTMVILNNYDLNLSEKYWTNPEKFNPDRFMDRNGNFRKPSHFIPFSNGKRACMGYKIVEIVAAAILTEIIRQYDMVSLEEPTILPTSCVAIHPKVQLRVKLIPRE